MIFPFFIGKKKPVFIPTDGAALNGSGYLYLNPTLGSELLTNTDFASDTIWTKGTGWSISGGVAVATSATGNLTQTLTADPFDYVIGFALTRTAGTARPFTGGSFSAGITTDGTYRYSSAGNGSAKFGMGVSTSFSGTVDNISLKRVISNSEISFLSTQPRQIGVKLPAFSEGHTFHLRAYKDSTDNPSNFIQARMSSTVGTPCRVTLQKIVGGTATTLISFTGVTFSANALLEIRRTANTTFQLWYNGVQVGTDQTIADSGILSNSYHGLKSLTSDWLVSEFQINNLVCPFRV